MDYSANDRKCMLYPIKRRIVRGFVNNQVCRYEVPVELHSETEISNQPYSEICVRYLVYEDLNDVASPTVRRNGRTVYSNPLRILAKSSERAIEGLERTYSVVSTGVPICDA